MDDLKLALHGLDAFNEKIRRDIVWIIKSEFDPLVTAAGKHLRIITGRFDGDLNINFDSTTPAGKPCRYVWLGEDGGQTIYVHAHEELRVCNAPNPGSGQRDLRRILTSDRLLARALANTAIHELGHYIALLDDLKEEGNYMCTGSLPVAKRTMKNQQNFFAGPQRFTTEQKEQLIKHLKTGEYSGAMTVIYEPAGTAP